MKKYIGHFLFIFSLLLVFSCEPNRAENGDFLFGVQNPGETGGGGNGGGSGSDRMLKKILSHYIDDNGNFEDGETVFNYEGKKLVSYVEDSGEPTVFTYNANNKISKLTNSAQNVLFTYSGNNLSKITSDIAGFYKVDTDFTYAGTQVSKAVSIQEFTFPVPTKVYIETIYEYTGQNMTKATVKNGFYLPNGELEINPEVQILSFQYDTKKSAYQLLPKEFFIYLSGIAPQGGIYFSANNATKFTTTLAGTVIDVDDYTYTYDSADYPLIMKNSEQETTTFVY